jgi:hypothetical protein
MHSTKRTSANLILDYVLVDMMLGFAILFIVRILRSRIQRLLDCAVLRGRAAVMPKRTLVGRGGSLGNQYHFPTSQVVHES